MSTIAELWSWNSPAMWIASAMLLIYTLLFRAASLGRFLSFGLGLSLFLLAFISPLGTLADGYLFSAHMVQHLILLLCVPLCFMLSLPPKTVSRWCENALLDRVAGSNALPVAGCLAAVGAMWFWHIPVLCSASTESTTIGAIRDTTFLAAGSLFWWPVFAPLSKYRLQPLTGVTYLFTSCLGCTLLGIYITFTTVSVCPAFADPIEQIEIVTELYDAGFTPAVDQNLGGLLMWVPPCLLYVMASISLLVRWYATPADEPAVDSHASSNPPRRA